MGGLREGGRRGCAGGAGVIEGDDMKGEEGIGAEGVFEQEVGVFAVVADDEEDDGGVA